MRAAHTIRVAVGALAVVAVMAFGGAAGAQVGDYPDVLSGGINNPSPGVSCNNTGLTVTVDNFQPGAEVTFTLFSDPVVLGTVVAGADGVATLTFDLPAGTTLGQHTVVVEGINENGVEESFEQTISVVSCATNPPGTNPNPTTPGTTGGGLARTGTDLGAPLRIGMVAIAAGAALLLATRKRPARAA